MWENLTIGETAMNSITSPGKIATTLIERMTKSVYVDEISMGDQIMATQLKQMLGTRRVSDITADDIEMAIDLNSQLSDWILNTEPDRVAQSIRLAHETEEPQDE